VRAESAPQLEQAFPVQELRKISATATRGPREPDSVAGTVTVKNAAEIAAELANDIRDLIRYESGIAVSNVLSSLGIANNAQSNDASP